MLSYIKGMCVWLLGTRVARVASSEPRAAGRELLSLRHPRGRAGAGPGADRGGVVARAREHRRPRPPAPFTKPRHVYTDARRNAFRCITSALRSVSYITWTPDLVPHV